MRIQRFVAVAVFGATLISTSAYAEGTLQGAAQGAEEGGRAAGPLGAIVGGAVGAATGTVEGVLGVDDRPRFREYVIRERRPSLQVFRRASGRGCSARKWCHLLRCPGGVPCKTRLHVTLMSMTARFWSNRGRDASSKSSTDPL